MTSWKKALTYLSVVALNLGASGCATEAQYRAKINTWRGKPGEELVRAWGNPDVIEKVHGDHKVLMFIRLKHPPYAFGETRRDLAGLGNTKTESSTPQHLIQCPTYFEENSEGKIVSIEYRGDECTWKN